MPKIPGIVIPVKLQVDDSDLQKIKQAAQSAGRGAAHGTPASSGGSTWGRSGGRPPIIDPDAAIAANTAGAVRGDPYAVSVVNAASRQRNANSRAYNAVSPPDPRAAFKRTRWTNVGGKLVGSPLGRDLGSMIGSMGSMGQAAESAMGGSPFTAAATALTGAMLLLNKTLGNMARGGGNFNTAMQTSLLATATGGAGPENFSQASGLKAALLAQMGENPIRGYFGDIDDNETYLRVARKISKMPYQQARKLAGGLGDPSLANFSLMDPWVSERALRDQKEKGGGGLARLTANAQGLAPDLLMTALGPLASIIDGPANPASRAADKMDKAADKMVHAAQQMSQGVFGPSGRAPGALPKGYNPSLDKQGLNSIGRGML